MLFMFILHVEHITRLTFKKYHLVSCLFNHVSIDVHYFFIICRTHCILKKRAPNNIFYMVLYMFFLFILFVAHITWLINSARSIYFFRRLTQVSWVGKLGGVNHRYIICFTDSRVLCLVKIPVCSLQHPALHTPTRHTYTVGHIGLSTMGDLGGGFPSI